MAAPDQQQIPQLFGVIPTGSPCLTIPTSALSPTSYVYVLPTSPRPFSHICVFLLPGITLPPDTAAAVYASLPTLQLQQQPQFKFLGGIGPGKESAVFKVSGLMPEAAAEISMLDSSSSSQPSDQPLTLGISLEPSSSVSAQMAQLAAQSPAPLSTSTALVPASSPASKPPDTLLLAQRIIKNAFNFLASFSGNINGGVEVVPLKAFEEWWRKFEGRVRSDPTFLERAVED